MTNDDIEKAVTQEMGECYNPSHYLRSGIFNEERIRRGLTTLVGDEPLDYAAIRLMACEVARKLVLRAYEEAAQEAEFPIHAKLSECGDRPHEGCVTGGYIARTIRALKGSLVKEKIPA